MWQDPNVEDCHTEDIPHIREEVNNLIDTSNLTRPGVIQNITEEFARVTEKNATSIFPNDLQSAISITRDIIRLTCEGLAIHKILISISY